MSTNNKWQALSMKDRAFLIREAVRNGITDINSIRNTWEHRFDGESSQPTEDEYIAQRAKEKIVEALTSARNRKETIQPYVEKSQKYKEDELEKLQMYESELSRLYKRADLTSKMNLSYDELGVPKITKVIDPNIQERIHRLQDYVNKYKIECSKSHTHGPGCIATVMDDYGKTETWNERFAKNPRAVGFVEINDSDILPGDIVQFGSSYSDFRTGESGIDFNHAMMANTPYNEDISKMRYNGSNGGDEVRVNSKYPSHWEETVGYRFVGDKADSLQWKKEYREKYGHQFSGEEPNIFTDTWDTIKGWFSKKESIEQKPTTEGPVDLDELKIRQSWAESRFKDNAVSSAGATGRFQVMPNVKADYIKAGGRNGNLKDPKYNEEVRDWQMGQLAKRSWINKEESTDSVKVGKQLAAYNYGPTNTVNALNKAKAAGIDIYKSFDWIDEAYLPKETVDYVNWTLRNKSTGVHRNDSVYNLNKHKYKKNKK